MDELAADADDTKGIKDESAAQADDPAQTNHLQDLPNGAAPDADEARQDAEDATQGAEDQKTAGEEAEPEVPAIPADMPAHILMSRQADRSAVNAPTEAIGEPADNAGTCMILVIITPSNYLHDATHASSSFETVLPFVGGWVGGPGAGGCVRGESVSMH